MTASAATSRSAPEPPPRDGQGATESVARPPHWSPAARSRRATVIVLAIAAAAILLILRAWHLPPFSGFEQTTENAYVRGRTTVIAPQVSGYVVEVAARDYEHVSKGQVLVRIDDRIYRAKVAAAEANLKNAKAALANSLQAHASRAAGLQSQTAGLAGARAQLDRARADLARIDDLVSDGSVSRRERDQAAAALAVAEATVRQSLAAGEIARQDVKTVDVGKGGLEAQVEAAEAQLLLAQIDLQHTVVRAPEEGQLGEVGVRLGQYVTNGSQLLSLVPPDRWIIANYKEAQTGRMRRGQPVRFTVDALEGQAFSGRILDMSPAAGSEFAVLKPDNATGNFVKIPQRIGVRVSIDPGQPGSERLRPGMSVETDIDTRLHR